MKNILSIQLCCSIWNWDLPRWKGKPGKDAFQYDKRTQSLVPWEETPSSLLPHFSAASGAVTIGDVNAWWSEEGIYLQLRIFKKRALLLLQGFGDQPADGLQFWIDTRCSPHIHRATSFAIAFFLFLQAGRLLR